MVADELRRQADYFMELQDLQPDIARIRDREGEVQVQDEDEDDQLPPDSEIHLETA